MQITFSIPDDKVNALLSALSSAMDNADTYKRLAQEDDDSELVASWESDEEILSTIIAAVEAQTPRRK